MKNPTLNPLRYPNSDLDRPEKVRGLLGSFWDQAYGGRELLKWLIRANLELSRQRHQDLNEIGACLSRKTVPLYHTETWLSITFRQSEMWEGFAWDLPAGVVAVPMLQNRMTNPSLVWIAGQEYVIEGNKLIFRQDPFQSPLLPQAVEIRSAGPSDREVVMWAFKSRMDHEYVYKHFGCLLNDRQPTSQGYKDRINAIMDIMVYGASTAALRAIVAMIHGIPVTLEPEETIEDVCEARTGPLVVTGSHVYRLPRGSTSAVSCGQRVRQGTPLVDACAVVDINWMPYSGINELTIPSNLLPTGVKGPLTFVNRDVALTLDPVRFDLGGDQDDQNCFWEQSCQPALQEMLTGAGRPPMAINPMQFLLQHVLRGNCLVILKQPCCPPPLVPLNAVLQQVVPPQIAVLTQLLPDD